MKKLILFACSVAFAGMINVNAQDCTPQLNQSANLVGLNPNPPAGSVEGVPYDEVNTLVIPRQVDNTLTGTPGDSIPLCAVAIVGINNMPPGYTYDVWGFNTNTPSFGNPYDIFASSLDTINIYPVVPVTRICIRLKNPTPPASSNSGDGLPDRDTVLVDVVVEAYTVLFPPNCQSLGSMARDTFSVRLAIKDAVYAGIDDENDFGFTVQGNYPNPSTDFTNIMFATPTASEVSINIYDMAGRSVHTYKGTSYVGENKYGLSTENFKSGVYMYSITVGGKTISKKMIVSK